MEKDPIFAEAERLYMLENPGGCLAAEDETVKRYWRQRAVDTRQRFDIRYDESGPSIDYHFCRSWEPDETGEMRGCYGTNKSHGYTLSEACEEIAKWHENEAKAYRDGTHYELAYFLEPANPGHT